MSEQAMSPRRPYLLRAMYEWLVDNQLTPHLVVNASVTGCQLPWEFVKNGQIVLNVSPTAVAQLQMHNEFVEFNARFSGKPHHVVAPMAAVMALYARENGAGTLFEEEAYYSEERDISLTDDEPTATGAPPAVEPAPEASNKQSSKPKRKTSHLKVVK